MEFPDDRTSIISLKVTDYPPSVCTKVDSEQHGCAHMGPTYTFGFVVRGWLPSEKTNMKILQSQHYLRQRQKGLAVHFTYTY